MDCTEQATRAKAGANLRYHHEGQEDHEGELRLSKFEMSVFSVSAVNLRGSLNLLSELTALNFKP